MKYIIILLFPAGLIAQEYETVKVNSGQGNTMATHTEISDTAAAIRTAVGTKQATLVSGTNIKTVNGSTLLGSGNLSISGAPTFVNLASPFSSTSTTLAAVTGWSFAVTSGVTYRVEVIADYQTAATTTGGTFGISLTGATGTIRGVARGSITAAAAATEVSIPIRATSGAGSTVTTTAVSATNTPHFLHMVVTFTCTGSGTFNIVWASEVAASAAQINANSSLIYQSLN